METIVLWWGCFWCLDAVFRRVNWVESVICWYSWWNFDNPNYENVSSGSTGHAEVIKIEYDPLIISFEKVLEIFFTIHDPTSLNRQWNDIGTQYRSIILYTLIYQNMAAESYIRILQDNFENPIVTEIKPLEVFYPAEEYHQNYLEKNPFNGYCMVVVAPKVKKIYDDFDYYLKQEYKG